VPEGNKSNDGNRNYRHGDYSAGFHYRNCGDAPRCPAPVEKELVSLVYATTRWAICARPDEGAIMAQLISRLSKDETAATAIEYSLIAAGIALAIVVIVQAIGTQVQVPYSTVSSALK
jgi:pilus assembly protein Flp/PilA